MKIERLSFEKKEIEVRETYIGEDGLERVRIKKVLAPTGKCLNEQNSQAKEKDG